MFNLRGQPSEWSPQPCVLRYAPLRCQCQQTLPEIDGNHSQQPQDDAISSWSAVKKEEHNWIAGFKWTDFLHRCNQLLSLSFQIRKFRWVNQPQIIGPLGWVTRYRGDTLHRKTIQGYAMGGWHPHSQVCAAQQDSLQLKSYNLAVVCNNWNLHIYILYIAIYHPYITIIYPSH